MNRLLLITSLFLYHSIIWGQTYNTPLSLFSTAGGQGQTTINQNSQTIEWTIGEPIIGIGTMNNQSIVIGEQQGNIDSLNVGISETELYNIKVFPNPANNFINIENLPIGEKKIILTHTDGKLVHSTNSTNNFQTVSTSGLASGDYILTILIQNLCVKSLVVTIVNH